MGNTCCGNETVSDKEIGTQGVSSTHKPQAESYSVTKQQLYRIIRI